MSFRPPHRIEIHRIQSCAALIHRDMTDVGGTASAVELPGAQEAWLYGKASKGNKSNQFIHVKASCAIGLKNVGLEYLHQQHLARVELRHKRMKSGRIRKYVNAQVQNKCKGRCNDRFDSKRCP